MKKSVLIIGGGITGLKSALSLEEMGIESVIVEKQSVCGGKVKDYSRLFPDFRSGRNLVDELMAAVRKSASISVRTGKTVKKVEEDESNFRVILSDGEEIQAGGIVLSCGFDPFDARQLAEYGYGIYPNVVTSLDLEALLSEHGKTGGRLLRPFDGREATKVAIIFCVGSRNTRIGNPHCSRICCSYSIKQAIEIKEKIPSALITCFYMDVRTYGRGFEDMFQYAQELGVKFVRGRVSECGLCPDGDIQVRAENTLLSRPFQGIFDIVSLSVGMAPCADAAKLAGTLGIKLAQDGFFQLKDEDHHPHESSRNGVYVAGAATGLKPVRDCLLEGVSVAGCLYAYLNG